MTATTLELIQDILIEQLGLGEVPAPGETLEDLGADSLDHVEIAMAIESEFPQVGVSDAEANGIKTVQDILDLLHTKGID